jgi:metallo-beta-lactamase family protein
MNGEIDISFWGAARDVTGSRHLLGLGAEHILMDCGLVQGKRAEANRANRELPFKAGAVSAVLLSHAHMDHSGNLPSLVARGFKGKIHCTKATAALAAVMLKDSAHIQERDAEWLNRKRKRGEALVEPLYDLADVERTLKLLEPHPYRKPFAVRPGVTATFRDAGHILGSAFIETVIERGGGQRLRLTFSGDLGRRFLPILKDPEQPEAADVLIMESTYGDRFHADIRSAEEQLGAIVGRTAARGGKVIIPAFSVGRSQEVIYELHRLITAGQIPDLPIYIDSPLTAKVSQVFAAHEECFDAETWAVISAGGDPFGFSRMRYVESVEESKRLNNHRGPCVIISASGMCEAGRVLHHLANSVEDARNTVLIVGYQAGHTLGRRLEEGAKQVRILGEEYQVAAEVVALHAYSAHADRLDLLRFYEGMREKPGRIFLVHGEERQSEALAVALREKGAPEVKVPALGERFRLE